MRVPTNTPKVPVQDGIRTLPQGGSGKSQPPRGPDEMLLRDWLAGLAMQALVASGDEEAGDRLEDIPGYAYGIADKMIAAREARTQ